MDRYKVNMSLVQRLFQFGPVFHNLHDFEDTFSTLAPNTEDPYLGEGTYKEKYYGNLQGNGQSNGEAGISQLIAELLNHGSTENVKAMWGNGWSMYGFTKTWLLNSGDGSGSGDDKLDPNATGTNEGFNE
jgi:hypothetical protein